jgi:hypothetical protein
MEPRVGLEAHTVSALSARRDYRLRHRGVTVPTYLSGRRPTRTRST